MNSITTVVFDLGNVLVRWNPRNLYRKVFKTENEMEWFLSHICTPEWNDTLDAGRNYSMAVKELAIQYPEWKKEIEFYDSRWEEMFDHPIEENIALLKDLKRNDIPVFAISNWSAEKFKPALKLFPFFSEFDGMIISGHEKVKKPDPKIFEIFLNRYNKHASECFFIDDLEKNTAAAEKLGFRVHHFTDIQKLHEEIRFHIKKPLSLAVN